MAPTDRIAGSSHRRYERSVLVKGRVTLVPAVETRLGVTGEPAAVAPPRGETGAMASETRVAGRHRLPEGAPVPAPRSHKLLVPPLPEVGRKMAEGAPVAGVPGMDMVAMGRARRARKGPAAQDEVVATPKGC